ncbi:MAG TPA: hypothetical protein VM029_02060 [Opitutaceae bacterium]|nr:hypothetical protein [Opitutaceae bacterium]
MQLSRSPRATYVAAFLLGALIALLLLAPARGAEPTALSRQPGRNVVSRNT